METPKRWNNPWFDVWGISITPDLKVWPARV